MLSKYNLRGIKTSYSASAGTAYVVFDRTVVPRTAHGPLAHRAPSTRCTADPAHHVWLQVVPSECVLGEVGDGFKLAMSNFNKERWMMIAGGNRLSRLMVEECFKWTLSREVFGEAAHSALPTP